MQKIKYILSCIINPFIGLMNFGKYMSIKEETISPSDDEYEREISIMKFLGPYRLINIPQMFPPINTQEKLYEQKHIMENLTVINLEKQTTH